jgi:hypothetical protein
MLTQNPCQLWSLDTHRRYATVTRPVSLLLPCWWAREILESPACVKGGLSTTHNTVTLNGPAPRGRRGCHADQRRPLSIATPKAMY